MRILGARIFFLSFLAGKLITFERMLLTVKIWRMRIFERENLTILNRVPRE